MRNEKAIFTWIARSCYAGGMKKLALLALFVLFAVFSLAAVLDFSIKNVYTLL